jgi:hypothetical protein
LDSESKTVAMGVNLPVNGRIRREPKFATRAG